MIRKATFTLTPLDMRRAQRLQCFASIREPRTLVRLSLLWLVSTAAWTAVLLVAGSPWNEAIEGIWLAGAVFAFAVFVFPMLLTLSLGPLVIRRRFRQEKQLGDPVEAIWDDKAYDVRTRITQTRVPWREYVKWRENAHCFTLHLSDAVYQVLPKRALTAEQIADIRNLLEDG